MSDRPCDWEEQDNIENEVAALRDQLELEHALHTWIDNTQTTAANSRETTMQQLSSHRGKTPRVRLWEHWPNWRQPQH